MYVTLVIWVSLKLSLKAGGKASEFVNIFFILFFILNARRVLGRLSAAHLFQTRGQ